MPKFTIEIDIDAPQEEWDRLYKRVEEAESRDPKPREKIGTMNLIIPED
tara:strand:+ start:384 stop:530 length:147 start_codon:yes stop_codon:yes gene_type:complete